MFFAKEMNLLSTRMMVLSKASALTDALIKIPTRVLCATYEPGLGIADDDTNDFDDIECMFTLPDTETALEYQMNAVKKGSNYYETTVSLQVSQQTSCSAPIEDSLKAYVTIFFTLNTDIFLPDGTSVIGSINPFYHHIAFVINVDKNGAIIDKDHSTVSIDESDYEDYVTDSTPEVDRKQLKAFFDAVLEAVDNVNGDKKYSEKHFDLPFETEDFHYNFGMNFDNNSSSDNN